MFRTVPLSIIRNFFHCTHSNGICADSLRAGSGRNCGSVLILLAGCQQTCTTNIIVMCTVKNKTPDDGQRNCPIHVDFYSKNKFEKLLHLVGFILRIFHDARPPECHIFSNK